MTRALKMDPLLTGMFDVFFEDMKIVSYVLESTPIKKITAALLCRWVYHHLHYLLHNILVSLIYLHLTDRSIDRFVVRITAFEYYKRKRLQGQPGQKFQSPNIILSARVRTQFALRN